MLIANIATIKEKYIFIQRLMLWLTSCIFVGGGGPGAEQSTII